MPRPLEIADGPPIRFVEDHVVEQAALGVGQYVILGAGLYMFAQ
jgi:hypothetical protein